MTDETIESRLPGRLQATFWPGAPVPSAGHLALWGGLPDAELDEAVAALRLEVARAARLPTVLPRTARAHRRVTAAEAPARLGVAVRQRARLEHGGEAGLRAGGFGADRAPDGRSR